MLTVIVYGAASTISIHSFFPPVVASFGCDRIATLPPYLFTCLVCVGVSWSADRLRERY